MVDEDVAPSKRIDKVHTLGSVQLRDAVTNEHILIPTPSADPNDPLNWSKPFKYYAAILVCMAMVMCNFLAAGPTIAIVETALDFFPDASKGGQAGVVAAISKTAYFFNCTALFQGLGNLIWMPIINKYGRRPAYVIAFTLYTITAVWASVATQYANFLVARIVMGFAAGAGECMAPLTIADIFFLHERGAMMSFYTASLNFGVAAGIIIDGFITENHPWRYIYYVAIALIGFITILVVLTFPETAYVRAPGVVALVPEGNDTTEQSAKEAPTFEHGESVEGQVPRRKTWKQNLRLTSGAYTSEKLWQLMVRPIMLLALVPVLWATLVMSVTIGFITAITSNVASAFSTVYGFAAWQAGLSFIAALIGAFLGIFVGGRLSDAVADFFTRRNNGIREPEFRLPAIMFTVVAAPLALILYGVGINNGLHWMVPVLGIGLINFAITQGTNVSLVYTIDAYRPIAGEITVTQLAFKSCFGFLLGFYTNPWVEIDGYSLAFGEMAAIAGIVLVLWVPLFFWGKWIRQKTLGWGIMRYVRWDDDRETGE